MQKEAEALLDAALALQKSGASNEVIRVSPYFDRSAGTGTIQVSFSLPVILDGLTMKVSTLEPVA